MPAFDSAKSLQCANCHGADASGGAKDFVLTPDAQGNTKATPVSENWVAPSLNDVMYRFNECTPEELTAKAANCTSRAEQQVTQVITYGRPGTPMPAWGVAGGGPKNEQAVSDLVAYLKSIQITPAQAKAQAAKKVADVQVVDEGPGGDRAEGARRRAGEPGHRQDRRPAPEVPERDHRRPGGHHPLAATTTRRCSR